MALETVGENWLLRTAGKKFSCPQVFSNSELLSHDSLQSRAEDCGKHFQAGHKILKGIPFRAWWLWTPVLFFTWLGKKNQGVQGKEGPYFGKKWAQVGTLWGKRNLELPYLENSFQPVAKLYPHFSPSALQPTLAVLFYVMSNPHTLQIRGGGGKAACGSLCFGAFFKPDIYNFILCGGCTMAKGRGWKVFTGSSINCQQLFVTPVMDHSNQWL